MIEVKFKSELNQYLNQDIISNFAYYNLNFKDTLILTKTEHDVIIKANNVVVSEHCAGNFTVENLYISENMYDSSAKLANLISDLNTFFDENQSYIFDVIIEKFNNDLINCIEQLNNTLIIKSLDVIEVQLNQPQRCEYTNDLFSEDYSNEIPF